MAFSIQTKMNGGDGQFDPIMKYNAQSGHLYRIDRIGGANGYESIPTDLPAGTKMLWDFGSIEEGWLYFTAGQPPSYAMQPVGSGPLPERPSQEHRQGFRMKVHLGNGGGGIRELASATMTLVSVVDAVMTEFEAAPEARQGLIPVVEFGGTNMNVTKNAYGTRQLYSPILRIVGWRPRPADLGERIVPPPGSAPKQPNGGAAAATAQPRAPVTAPAPKSMWDPPAQGQTLIEDDSIPF